MQTLVRCVQLCLAESMVEAGCLSAVLGTLSAVKTLSGLLLHLVAVFADLQRIVTLLVLLRGFRAHPGPWRPAARLHARLIIVGPITNSLVLSLAYFNHLFGEDATGDSLAMSSLTGTLLFLSVVNACLFVFWLMMVLNPWWENLTHKLKVTASLEPRTFQATASHNGDDSNCSICLSEVEAGDVMAQLPCGHHFHEACIRSWLTTGGICPMRCPPPELPADHRIQFRETYRALLGLALEQWHIILARWLAYARAVRWAATGQWCRRSNRGSQPPPSHRGALEDAEAEPGHAPQEDVEASGMQAVSEPDHAAQEAVNTRNVQVAL